MTLLFFRILLGYLMIFIHLKMEKKKFWLILFIRMQCGKTQKDGFKPLTITFLTKQLVTKKIHKK